MTTNLNDDYIRLVRTLGDAERSYTASQAELPEYAAWETAYKVFADADDSLSGLACEEAAYKLVEAKQKLRAASEALPEFKEYLEVLASVKSAGAAGAQFAA